MQEVLEIYKLYLLCLLHFDAIWVSLEIYGLPYEEPSREFLGFYSAILWLGKILSDQISGISPDIYLWRTSCGSLIIDVWINPTH